MSSAQKLFRYLWIFLLVVSSAFAAPTDPVDAGALARAIGERRSKVAEFAAIRKLAEKEGVRVWLFGGTAATFAHYVKWDLLRERDGKAFPAAKFDYDLCLSILMPTQDLDLVVDGDADRVQRFRSAVEQLYPYKTEDESRSRWEIRALKTATGDKPAPLSPDFLAQHNDSLSTLLIELTEEREAEGRTHGGKREAEGRTHDGEPLVRDAREWESGDLPQSFTDLSAGKIRYLYSSKHDETERARGGKNPPILSVVRFLTKAFQFGYEIDPRDRSRIARIISGTDPSSLRDSYVQRWLNIQGPKLVRNAYDVIRALAIIDELELKKALLPPEAAAPAVATTGPAGVVPRIVRGSPGAPPTRRGGVTGAAVVGVPPRVGIRPPVPSSQPRVGTLAWWLGKEPLRDRDDPKRLPTRTPGRTAEELGIKEVAHDTSDLDTYLSIVWSPNDRPNLFISRSGHPGETAQCGDGFYTLEGSIGAKGGKFPIRFSVDSNAREGVDFARVNGTTSILWLTRDKLHLIREPIALNDDLIRRAIRGDETNEALATMIQRRLSQLPAFTPEQNIYFKGYIKALADSDDAWAQRFFVDNGEVAALITRFSDWPEFLESLLTPLSDETVLEILKAIVELPAFAADKQWTQFLNRLSAGSKGPTVVLPLLLKQAALAGDLATDPIWADRIESMISSGDADEAIKGAFEEQVALRLHYRYGLWLHALDLEVDERAKFFESNPLPTGLTEHTLNRCIEILKRKGS